MIDLSNLADKMVCQIKSPVAIGMYRFNTVVYNFRADRLVMTVDEDKHGL